MPSLVTSIIGGFQGASAAHNAANAQKQGYQQASTSVNNAVANANPLLAAAGSQAGAGVTDAAKTAGTGVTDAAKTAGTGVTNAAGGANDLLNPYISSGSTASKNLSDLTSKGFSFNPTDLQNDPGYQFTQQRGMNAIANSTSAHGGALGGAALKAAMEYQTGLSDTTYGNAFNRAMGTYQTNVNSLLPQAQMGMAASGTAGNNLMNAAQYTGNTGMAGAEYAGNANINAAQYAGNAGMWAGGQQASNLVNAGVYQGNTQIGSGNAQAQGDIGAANAWNGMLTGVGNAANTALMAGFGGGGGGWSFSNMGNNFSNMFSAGAYGRPAGGGGAPGYGFGAPVNYPQPAGDDAGPY